MVSAFTLAARFFLADSAFACSSVRSGSAAKSASLFAMPAVIIPSARSRSSLIVSLFIFVFLSFSCVPQRGSGVLAACRKRNFRLEQAARRRFPFGLHKSLADSERRAAFWAFDDRVGRDVRHLVRGGSPVELQVDDVLRRGAPLALDDRLVPLRLHLYLRLCLHGLCSLVAVGKGRRRPRRLSESGRFRFSQAARRRFPFGGGCR